MKALAPERFLIKFAHEMNGGGTPWSPINVGINPSGFVAAWQRVRTIFRDNGASNVEFVWAPIYQSNPNIPSNDIHLYYPGDSYVDWIGPSGYNFYTQQSPAQLWRTFLWIYDATLRDFACRYAKPQIIHEMGSVEGDTNSPSKTQWIADAYLNAPNYPFLRSIIWFNDWGNNSPSIEFRVTTSTYRDGSVHSLPTSPGGAWTTAYHDAVASSNYNQSLPSLLAAKPANALCANKVYLPLIIR